MPEDFITPIGTGMRRVDDADRTEFTTEAVEALHARLTEFDRVRNRGAVEASMRPLGQIHIISTQPPGLENSVIYRLAMKQSTAEEFHLPEYHGEWVD